MQTDQGYLPLEKAVDEHKIITDHEAHIPFHVV